MYEVIIMAERLTIQIKDNDNVVVAVHDLPAGTKTESGVVTRNPIPQAHKIALVDIPAGGEIIRYGVVLGYAKNDIPAGAAGSTSICWTCRKARH